MTTFWIVFFMYTLFVLARGQQDRMRFMLLVITGCTNADCILWGFELLIFKIFSNSTQISSINDKLYQLI